jgi:hypothetical protein
VVEKKEASGSCDGGEEWKAIDDCAAEAFDADGNGQVSLAEFAAFSRGAAHSAAYHGEMAVFQQRGGDTSDAAEASSAPPLSGPPSGPLL